MANWSPTQPNPSDEQLVAQIVRQDKAALALIYDRYAKAVYAVAVHLLDPTLAEESVQDVFIRLWHKADQFDAARGPFKNWFMTLARNQILDAFRQHCKEQTRTERINFIEQLLVETEDTHTNVFEEVWHRQQRDVILAAMRDLPAEQRQAIMLAYFGGYSQSSIAKKMGWPLGTVKTRIRLGLQKLRVSLLNLAQSQEVMK